MKISQLLKSFWLLREELQYILVGLDNKIMFLLKALSYG